MRNMAHNSKRLLLPTTERNFEKKLTANLPAAGRGAEIAEILVDSW
jgi:hypothetical protein